MANTHPIQSGDLKLIPSTDGARLDFSGGQPLMDQGLETCVYISLFCADWWGNATVEPKDRQASRVPEVAASATITNQSRVALEQAARDTLQWMIVAGIAASVTPSVQITSANTATLTVAIEQPNAPREVLRYQVNWGKQKELVASGRITRRI